MKQPGLFNSLIARCTEEVLNNVARIAARCLANDLAVCDMPGVPGSVLDAAA